MIRNLLFLSKETIKKVLTIEEAIPAVRDAFIQLSSGKVEVPLRVHLDIPQFQGVELIKPVYSPLTKKIGIKIISLFKNNTAKKLPYSHAVMLLLDAETGIPLAIMDADYLTAVRTAAASGVATELLARKESGTVAIFGAGPQGAAQVRAMMAVCQISQIFIFDPDTQKARKLANNISSSYAVEVKVSSTPHSLSACDIICTATTSEVPVFLDSQISAGVHINGMGSFKPHHQEIPAETVKRSRLFVDQRESCLKEAGDIIIPLKRGMIQERHILAEIGEIASGAIQARKSDADITIFKSVGNAVQDLAVAEMVYGKALKNKLGQELKL
ncbi:MAG: ornithine cyclodeaminase family protein [bacterium]|nr:MAG: ornithine cyclodeaminase family protein [bacterium]